MAYMIFRSAISPRPSGSSLYQQFSDELTLLERQAAIDQGGEIFNPETYSNLANIAAQAAMKAGLDANQRRDLYNKSLEYRRLALKTEVARKKDLNVQDIRNLIEEDLRILSHDVPNNPYIFAREAEEVLNRAINGYKERQGLVDLINDLNAAYVNTSELTNLLEDLTDARNMYADIKDAFETGNLERLENYVITYTPSISGKVMGVKISRNIGERVGVASNMKFILDKEGNPQIVDGGKSLGLQIRFFDPDKRDAIGQKYINFANLGNERSLKYDDVINQYRADFTVPIDVSEIKYEPMHNISPGNFAIDTKGRKYYVNMDKTISPIANDFTFKQLGGDENKLYKMTKEDELNILRGTVGPSIKLYERPETYRALKESIWSDYEAEKAQRETGIKGLIRKAIGAGLIGITGIKPGMPAVEEAPYRAREAQLKQMFPAIKEPISPPAIKKPKEEEATAKRTVEIIHSLFPR